METYLFIVEETQTGYSAYAAKEEYAVGTVGANLEELRKNAAEAMGLWLYDGKSQVRNEQIEFKTTN